MNEPCARITLDVQQSSSAVFVAVKRGDIGRKIVISLSDGGFPYEIASDCYAVLTGTKPDGNILYNHCDIEGNTIVYEITEQTTAAAGRMMAEVKLYGADDNLVTSATFRIIIDGTVYTDGQVESSSEFSALKQLMSQVLEVIQNNSDSDSSDIVGIKSVTEILNVSTSGTKTLGYTVTLTDGNSYDLYHGKDGSDGLPGADGFNVYLLDSNAEKMEDSDWYESETAIGSTPKVGDILIDSDGGVWSVTEIGPYGFTFLPTYKFSIKGPAGASYTLTEDDKAEIAEMVDVSPDSGGNANGLSTTAANLLITILRNGVYSTDQSANITALETALASGGDEEEPDTPVVPDEPVVVTYTVTSGLTNVESTNASAVVNEGASYTATLTAADGYELDSVIVTMGGVDITATAYADGVVNIPSVTGNVIVTATAVEVSTGENNGWVDGEAYEIEWTDGALDSTGAETESTNMSVSNFLPCRNVSRMVTSGLYSDYQLWYYDADKNFLRKSPISFVVDKNNIETYRDAYYVRTYKRMTTTSASVVPYYDDLLDANTAWEADKFYRLNWTDEGPSELAFCYGASTLQFSNAARSFVTWYDADKNEISTDTRQNVTTAVSVPEGACYFSLLNNTFAACCNFWVKLA